MRWVVLLLAFIVLCAPGCGAEGGDDEGLLGSLTPDESTHVSAREQRALPVDAYFLADALCPAGYVEDPIADRWRRRARIQSAALMRALRLHPDHTVTVRFQLADPEAGEERTQTEELTVRELAQSHVQTIGNGGEMDRAVEGDDAIDCRLRLKRKLTALVEASG